MSDRDRIDFNKKKLWKKNNQDEERKMKTKANKQFKHKKLELYDEDTLKEIENYK